MEILSTWFTWTNIFLIFFALPLIKLVLTVLFQIFKQLFPIQDIKKRYCASNDSWAVVTGATDGIGLGFCQVLTAMGINVALVSRNAEKLEATVEKLKGFRSAQYPQSQFKTFVFDFKQSSNEQKATQLLNELNKLDIGILVNNVGTSQMKLFEQYNHQNLVDLLNVNVVSMSVITAGLIGKMRKRGSSSALINLSSYMGEGAIPFLSLYAATKAFNLRLTEGLVNEYTNVDVMCLKPMFVESPLSKQKKGFGVPDRRECALDSLRELRWSTQTYGYISHRIIGYLTRNCVPQWIYNLIIKIGTKKALKKLFPKSKFE